jgi:hypothetical protein
MTIVSVGSRIDRIDIGGKPPSSRPSRPVPRNMCHLAPQGHIWASLHATIRTISLSHFLNARHHWPGAVSPRQRYPGETHGPIHF